MEERRRKRNLKRDLHELDSDIHKHHKAGFSLNETASRESMEEIQVKPRFHLDYWRSILSAKTRMKLSLKPGSEPAS